MKPDPDPSGGLRNQISQTLGELYQEALIEGTTLSFPPGVIDKIERFQQEHGIDLTG
jgi:hypothetical protein